MFDVLFDKKYCFFVCIDYCLKGSRNYVNVQQFLKIVTPQFFDLHLTFDYSVFVVPTRLISFYHLKVFVDDVFDLLGNASVFFVCHFDYFFIRFLR